MIVVGFFALIGVLLAIYGERLCVWQASHLRADAFSRQVLLSPGWIFSMRASGVAFAALAIVLAVAAYFR